MKIINKIIPKSLFLPNYQQLVCDKLNELTVDNFFSVADNNELISYGSCANTDYTMAFGVISAVLYPNVYGYFCFGYPKAPVTFYSGEWDKVWNAIKDITKDTTITIS